MTNLKVKALGGILIILCLSILLILLNNIWIFAAFYVCSLILAFYWLDINYTNISDILSMLSFGILILPLFAITGIAMSFWAHEVIALIDDITSYR